MRMMRMASHASFAEGLLVKVVCSSSGTPEQMASSAALSSRHSSAPCSTMSQRQRASSLSFIMADHES